MELSIGTNVGSLAVDTEKGTCRIENRYNKTYTAEDTKLLMKVLGFEWGSDVSISYWGRMRAFNDALIGASAVDMLHAEFVKAAESVDLGIELTDIRVEMYIHEYYSKILDRIGNVDVSVGMNSGIAYPLVDKIFEMTEDEYIQVLKDGKDYEKCSKSPIEFICLGYIVKELTYEITDCCMEKGDKDGVFTYENDLLSERNYKAVCRYIACCDEFGRDSIAETLPEVRFLFCNCLESVEDGVCTFNFLKGFDNKEHYSVFANDFVDSDCDIYGGYSKMFCEKFCDKAVYARALMLSKKLASNLAKRDELCDDVASVFEDWVVLFLSSGVPVTTDGRIIYFELDYKLSYHVFHSFTNTFVDSVMDVESLLFEHKEYWKAVASRTMILHGHIGSFKDCEWKFEIEGTGKNTKFNITCYKEGENL